MIWALAMLSKNLVVDFLFMYCGREEVLKQAPWNQ